MSPRANIAIAALVLAGSATAAADPIEPRLLTAPTAWLPGANAVVAATGLDMRGAGSIGADLGLGELAALELGVDSDARQCAAPPCGTDAGEQLAAPLHLVRAAFRLGAHQDAWFAGQPAVALGVRETIGGAHAVGEAYAVASRVLGPIRLHAGAEAIEGSGPSPRLAARPLAGVEYTPPQFRKTALLADLAWQPRFDSAAARPPLEWIAGIGVRYQAFAWGAIELDYRARQDESLAGSTVLVRVVGRWAPASPKRCDRPCAGS